MAESLLAEILKWSEERPAWQRDTLRRLFTTGRLTPGDLDELVTICKAARGLNESMSAQVLTTAHLAITGRGTDAVTLVGVTHDRGVNALAPSQTITFGPSLTVIYGPNASGKSGYIRILKRACRSRFTEEILGNVLSTAAPLKAEATIRFREGTNEVSFVWRPDIAPSDALAAVSAFDAHCVPVYLRDKTDVAFRPFGLDVFDQLSAGCGEVRARLEKELAELNAATPRLPEFPEGTRVRALVSGLTSLTKVDAILTLATVSTDEQRRLKDLRDRQRDLQAADPKQRARELSLKADRIDLLAHHITALVDALGVAGLAKLRTAAGAASSAREALAILRRSALTADLLPGSGEAAWRGMWEAAAGFSQVAYPDSPFPVLNADARCPFCQQLIGADASTRLKHFAEYVSSNAQAEVDAAERTYNGALVTATQAVVRRADTNLAISELDADDPDLAQRARAFFDDAAGLQEELLRRTRTERADVPSLVLALGPDNDLRAAAATLRERVKQLQTQATGLDASDAAELRELESRVTLNEHLTAVLGEIERQKRLAAYKQCLDDTSTQPITRKSTELTKRLVTDQLRKTFQDELAKLEFTHLAVEVQAAGGAKGALFHRLAFKNAPGVVVADVLSEGESRTLALAAFLTELSTATSRSAIIFDDPVSSLDHVWRGRIAHRLVVEAKNRQVIVFTHDILFLRLLIDQCGHQDVPCHHQYVRREGLSGISSPDLPWIAMNIKDRIGTLRKRWQEAEKLARTSGHETYEKDARDMYGLMREAWEQATSEVLLNDVVERYRHSVETQKVRYLHDITAEDCKTVEAAMSECSRWIRGHDHPAADGTPFPTPAELLKRIDELDGWVKAIRIRRR